MSCCHVVVSCILRHCLGLPVISICSSDWCAVRHLGQEVLSPHDGLLYLRPHPLHADQPLVSLCVYVCVCVPGGKVCCKYSTLIFFTLTSWSVEGVCVSFSFLFLVKMTRSESVGESSCSHCNVCKMLWWFSSPQNNLFSGSSAFNSAKVMEKFS